MDRSSLKIFARLRGDITGGLITTSNRKKLTIHAPGGRESHSFDLFKVFVSDTSQEEVFESAVRPLLENVREAYDAAFLCYGPAQSGKSFTVLGGEGQSRGMVIRAVEQLLEGFSRESAKYYALRLSVLELHGDTLRDLALGYLDPYAINTFASQNLDLTDVNERKMVSEATEIDIQSVEQAAEVIKKSLELRAAYEALVGRYEDKAHTFFILSLGQNYKKTDWDGLILSSFYIVDLASCHKPKSRQSKDYYEILNASSSFHALAKTLSLLNTPMASFSEHKLTRVLEPGLSNNSAISLVINVNPNTQSYEDSLQSLGFIERCKTNSAYDSALMMENVPGSDVKLKIQMLQDESAELKEKLRSIEIGQEDQLKAISQMLGLETDPEQLITAAPGSKVLQQLNTQKEAVLKIDTLIRQNRELERGIEDSRQAFDHIKRMEFSHQEKHISRVLELKDELTKLKDLLAETRAHADYTQKEHIESKTDELQRMLAHSQILMEEKTAIVDSLPEVMKHANMMPEPVDMKEEGRREVEEEFSKRFAGQEKNHQKQLGEIYEKYEHLIKEKDRTLTEMVANYKKTRSRKKQEISSVVQEMLGLYKLVQQQRRVLGSIHEGKYNQRLKPVFIPFELLPEMPNPESFPQLFAHIDQEKPSSHPLKRLQTELQQPQPVCAALSVDPSSLSAYEAKKTLVQLKDLYAHTERELQNAQQSFQGLEEQKNTLTQQMNAAREERDRYRDLYAREVNNRRETGSVIQSQRRIIEKNMPRPATQGKWGK